jgi:6,7-dimethyl-8-ribityllumazine synthase
MIGRPRVLIVEARFYEDVADELAAGAVAALDEEGVEWRRVAVPGSFEIPAAIAFAHRGRGPGTVVDPYDGFVALGCVIQGETDHYEHICREVSRALMDLAMRDGLALGFGVLTCATREQALARAAVSGMNRGAAAARACLRMIELKEAFSREVPPHLRRPAARPPRKAVSRRSKKRGNPGKAGR